MSSIDATRATLPAGCMPLSTSNQETAFQRDMALWKQELDTNYGSRFKQLTEQKAILDKQDEERRQEVVRQKKEIKR